MCACHIMSVELKEQHEQDLRLGSKHLLPTEPSLSPNRIFSLPILYKVLLIRKR